MTMFLLVDNYDSFTYNLYALFRLAGAELEVFRNNRMVDAEKYEGIIISPGPSTPVNAGYTLKYLEKYAGRKPVFGVCLGMQSIGHHLGYKVTGAKTIMHGKKDRILRQGKSMILDNLPQEFTAVRYHSLVVKTGDLITARSGSDDEAMSMEDEMKMLFGVQFHPESIMSEHGSIIAKNFITFCRRRKNG
jgi:anthranilate synthase component 2